MADEADSLLAEYLRRLQRSNRVRRTLAALLVVAILAVGGKSAYDLLPREFSLSITGGDMMGNRHYLAKVLQEEGARSRLSLRVVPTAGSIEALESVDAGKIDVAIIQGGLDASFPNIVHVATLSPELVHFLVKSDIAAVKDLRGRLINLGGKGGGTRTVARQILRYSNLQDNVDYSESNFSNEELIAMRPERLPDAVAIVSFAPSFMADFFVKERGYRLLEMPFPESLALRLGWVADSKVLAYTYSVSPPVPASEIKVIGVSSHVVANRAVDARAIFNLLDVLYGPSVENRFRQKFDETTQLTMPSGFDLSAGTEMFRERNDPLLSAKTADKVKSVFSLIMSVLSTILIVWRWIKNAPAPEPSSADSRLKEHLKAVVALDDRLVALGRGGYSEANLAAVEDELVELRRRITELAASTAKLEDPGLVHTALACVMQANDRLRDLARRRLPAVALYGPDAGNPQADDLVGRAGKRPASDSVRLEIVPRDDREP